MKYITDFHGEYNFLSNFAYSPIEYKGERYPTVEHAFQTQKFLDVNSRTLVRNSKSPSEAKRIGRVLLPRADWDSIKVWVMDECLRLKFAIPELAQQLKDTGDAVLVEGNHWHDNIWGDCWCKKCESIEGTNYLGKLLMEIRDSLE